LNGTWKAEGDAAVINWDTGWVTKIVKQGDKRWCQRPTYAFRRGPETENVANTVATPNFLLGINAEARALTPAHDCGVAGVDEHDWLGFHQVR
jgi:hypothetical protein